MSLRHARIATRSRGIAPVQRLEGLESRTLLAANPLKALKLSEATTHVSSTLLNLYDAVINGQTAVNAAKAEQFSVDAKERIGVTIHADDVAKVTKGLATLGFVATASFPTLHL